MSRTYGREDSQVFDYRMEKLHGEWFRGPLERGPDAIAWLGAAQTFGRYASDPFPSIVGNRLDLGTLNLGSGGKSPQYFLRHPELLDEVNRCRIAVIQVMSARGSDNSLFRSNKGGSIGVRMDTGTLTRSLTKDLLAEGRHRDANHITRESQRAYVQGMGRLLEVVRPPKILLCISFRDPPLANEDYHQTLGRSPQLVSGSMISEIVPSADRFVEVVSREGIPQAIRDRAGNTVGTNVYYPSPEMHLMAADQLTPVVGDLIGVKGTAVEHSRTQRRERSVPSPEGCRWRS